jgi:hypothetical protein
VPRRRCINGLQPATGRPEHRNLVRTGSTGPVPASNSPQAPGPMNQGVTDTKFFGMSAYQTRHLVHLEFAQAKKEEGAVRNTCK